MNMTIQSIGNEFLEIWNKDNNYMCFPDFPKGKYYKNMELDREYTLKELGL